MIAVFICGLVTTLILFGLIAMIAVTFAEANAKIVAALTDDPMRPAFRPSGGLRPLPA